LPPFLTLAMTHLPFRRTLNVKFLGCLLAAVLGLAGAAYWFHGFQVRRNASALLELADRSEKAGDYPKAAEYLKRYLQLSPHDADVRGRYALFLADEKKFAKTPQKAQEAFNALEIALRLNPERHELRRRIVQLAMDFKSYNDAAKHLDRLLQAFPHSALLEAQRARCYEANGEYKKARAMYGEAIAHAPLVAQHYADLAYLLRKHPREVMDKERNPDVVVQLADSKMDEMVRVNDRSYEARLLRVYYKKDFSPGMETAQLVKATEEDIRRSQELSPDAADVLLAVAALEQEKLASDKARACLQRGVKLYPDDWRMYRALARLESDEGHLEAAVDCLQSALKRMPNDVDVLWNLCIVLIESNRGAETRPLIERLRAAKRPDCDLDYLNGCNLFREGKWREAVEILERVYTPLMDRHAQHPDWFAFDYAVKASLIIGNCYEQLGNAERAAAAFHRVAKRSKASHRELARMEWALGHFDTAIEHYRQLLALPSAPPQAWLEFAQVLIMRNLQKSSPDWREANQVLDRADKLVPRPVEVPLLRAEVLVAQRQFGEARQVLENAYADKKSRPALIWVGLSTLEEQQGKGGKALELLSEGESYVGDDVALLLARARYWMRQPASERASAAKALAALSGDMGKFKPEERRLLVRELASAYSQIGDSAQAERLLKQLAAEEKTDLTSRMALFDLALEDMRLHRRDDGRMTALIDELKGIEGPEGTLWRYCRASQLVQEVARALRQAPDPARPAKIRNDPQVQQKVKEASALLDTVASQRPRWPRVPVCQGQLQELLGNVDGAIDRYQQAVLLGERDPALIRRVIEMLTAQQRYPEADQMLQRLGEGSAVFAGMERAAAEVMVAHRHDVAGAVKLAQKAVAADSKDFQDHLWLGRILWAAHQPAEASFRRAAALAPQEPAVWVGLVNYLVRSDNKPEAEKAVREAETRLPRAKKPLTLAQCYAMLGDHDRAARLYQEALQEQPNNLEVLHGVAVYHLQQSHMIEATRLLKEIVQRQTENPAQAAWARNLLALIMTAGNVQQRQEALALLGVSGAGDGRSDGGVAAERTRAQVLASQPGLGSRQEAIKILEKLRQEQKATSADRMLLAFLYDVCGTWPKARDEMLNLAAAEEEQLAKASPEFRGELGTAYAARLSQFGFRMLAHDEVAQAQAFLEKLEKLQPSAFGTVVLKARLLARAGRAGEVTQTIIDLARDKQELVEPVAVLLEDVGQMAAAEEMFKRFVNQSKKPEAILVLARFYGRQKLTDKALALCEGARKDCPPELVCRTAAMVLTTSKPTREQCQLVAGWLQEAIARVPHDKKLRDELAVVLGRQGDYKGMTDIYRGILQQDPADTKALNNLAWLQALNERNPVEAMKNIQKAISLDGPVANRLSTRAVIYLTMGQSQAAIKDLDEVIATSPSPLAYFRKARALHQAKQNSLAQRTFERALELGLTEAMLDPLELPTFIRLRRDLTKR
jgi:cellulose synthase operon protein C